MPPEPEQISVEVEVIVTDGVTIGFTVIVIPALVAGFPVAHGVALEVKTTVTTWPFVKVVVE